MDDVLLAATAKCIADARVSPEGREGIAAFLEKRAPVLGAARSSSPMFAKLLIANRGEIACRIARTARRLGIRTVAVYSDADAHAAHVAACDEAVHIGGPRPQESYLRGDVILEAARRTRRRGHSSRATAFCPRTRSSPRACARAGIVFVGPTPEAIAAMGSKSAAKALMEKAGVPLTPGYHGERQEPDYLLKQAERIGFPGAHQGGGRRRRQGHAARRPRGGFRRGARELPARGRGQFQGRPRAGREVPDHARGTSKSRCSATTTATPSIYSSAIARCSAVTRRSSKKRRRPA